MHRRWAHVLGLLGFGLGVATIPQRICRAGAADWYEGARARQEALASRVARWMKEGTLATRFSTGSPRFDSEWIFGTYQMAALGFGQVALEHPETRPLQRARMEVAIDHLLDQEGERFDTEAWGRSALSDLDFERGHVAYLGYTNLVLALHRTLFVDSRYAATNDAFTEALERRLSQSPILLAETYPGEIYPVDNASAIASIALHARATHRAVPAVVARWVQHTRTHYVDPGSGLLFQSVHRDGTPLDAPRGSGSALAAYFLSFGDGSAEDTTGTGALSAALHAAVQRTLARDVLGFRAVREYPSGRSGSGDIDSGPVVFGFGVSATGFSLAGCRIHRDPDAYARTLSTAQLFGAPLERNGELGYVSGGPLGDAILFAMQTAQRRTP